MSDYGDGTPPPPPPYGGGSQGGQYGQPQYGSPSPQQPQYGAPPPQPPQYGAPPPSPQQPYGAPPPQQPYGGYQPAPQQGYGDPYAAAYAKGSYGTPASMGKRFGARLIDGLIVSIPLLIIYFALIFPSVVDAAEGGSSTPPIGGLLLFQLLAIVVGIGYEVGLIATRGATVGKQLLGIKVIREVDGQIPGWGPAVLRWLIPLLGSFVCGIGQLVVYLSPFWDNTKRNQGWHDKVAKTLVVNR